MNNPLKPGTKFKYQDEIYIAMDKNDVVVMPVTNYLGYNTVVGLNVKTGTTLCFSNQDIIEVLDD